MNDLRVWSYIIAIAMYFLFQYPLPTIIVIAVLLVLYILILLVSRNIGGNTTMPNARRYARINALESVSMYLAPHTDIWRNLRISNKYCSLKLGRDGVTITAKETDAYAKGKKRSFKIVKSKVHTMQEIWNMYCLNFDHLTSYDGLVEMSKVFQVTIVENNSYSSNISKSEENEKQNTNIPANRNIKEKVDINNASEVEITALPGISIVMSKRIIKKREEIRGFKSLDDFFLFIKVRPHMQEQLKELVCINKMKGSVKIDRFKERNIDL
jgi:DNA uptake protein ComE-like DNA-binding protein